MAAYLKETMREKSSQSRSGVRLAPTYIMSIDSQAMVNVSDTWQAVDEMCEWTPRDFSEPSLFDVGSHGVYSSLLSMLGFGQEMVDFGVLLGRPSPVEKSLGICQLAALSQSHVRCDEHRK